MPGGDLARRMRSSACCSSEPRAGTRVDRSSVSNGADTACQDGTAKLDSVLDARAGESWQRSDAERPGGAETAARS